MKIGIEVYEQLFESANIGLCICDQNRKFLRINDALCRLLEYSREELLTMTVKDITAEEFYDENLKLHEEALEKDLPFFQMEKKYRKKSGELFWANLTVTFIEGDDGEKKIVGQVQDITNRKALEELEKLKLISAMIVTYNHEINNPLTIALHAIDALKKRGNQQEYIESLESSLERIRDVVVKIREAGLENNISLTNYLSGIEMLDIEGPSKK